MKPRNFPGRVMRRRLRADERHNPNGYDDQSEQSLLDAARAQRSKIHRKQKKGGAS